MLINISLSVYSYSKLPAFSIISLRYFYIVSETILGQMITSNQEFEAFFNYATIGIVVTNKAGIITNFNKYAETQFGYSKDEILGKSVEVLVPLAFHSAHQHHRHTFNKHPEPRRMGEGRDLFAQKKDGTEFPVEISLSYYKIEDEVFVIAFVIDITVRKQSEAIVLEQKDELERVAIAIKKLNAELEQKVDYRTRMLRETLAELEKSKEELNQALEKEKELNELKSRFVTTASHEFRTPLSTILSSSFLLEKYNNISEPDKRSKHIDRIKTAVADMKSILEDFLSLGKLEEGIIHADMHGLTSDELLHEISMLIIDLKLILKTGQQLIFEHSGNSSVLIDKQLLKQILTNLISNAIKFSSEYGIIEVRYKNNDEGLTITVKDNGIGISEEDQEHLFERFFRAKNAVNIQGTGLGLHIISKYLELMNGSISFESKLNEGTSFNIHIPKK